MEIINKLTMCRLCLCENECFFNIFERNDWQGYVASDVISDLLQFQVSETDGYPHVVCPACLTKLTDFRLFKKCCLISKVTYDDIFVPRKNPEEHKPGMVGLVTVKAEPIYYSDNEDDISKAYSEPVGTDEDNSHERGPMEGIDDLDGTDGDGIKKEPVEEELTPDLQYPQFLQHERSRRASRGAVDADSSARNVSTDDDEGREEKEMGKEGKGGRGDGPEKRVREGKGGGRGVEGKESFKCYHCGSVLETKLALTEHMKLHGFGHSYNCGVCGKVFRGNYYLQRHSLTHTCYKPYKCAECGKSFSRSDNLKLHMKTHAGPKSYKCAECGKSFSQNGSLKKHMTSHKVSIPFKCGTCSEEFAKIGDLRKHFLVHTQEKPHQCHNCRMRFSLIENLKIHLEKDCKGKTE